METIETKERDALIFADPIDWSKDRNGVKRFEGLSLDNLKAMLSKGFIDPNENQNNSPDTEEFAEFMENHPKFTAHGYIVSPYRNDARVTLEGVTMLGEIDKDDIIAFYEMFRYADEITANETCLHCWYD